MRHGLDYHDDLIAATDEGLVIRRYDVFLRPKRIRFGEIRSVRRLPVNRVRRWRLWGTTIPGYWFNLDLRRPRKSIGFEIDAGRWVQPVITPDDPDGLIAALASHGVAQDR